MSDLVVMIDGAPVEHIERFSLTRDAEHVTGEMTAAIFMSYTPQERFMEGVLRGASAAVYLGGHLAFNGTLDGRGDRGSPDGEYEVTLRARGRLKRIIDDSHRHPTGTILSTTDRGAFEALLAPFGVGLDWRAKETAIPRIRLRDGARVHDELRRIAQRTGLNFYETRDGMVRVVDQTPDLTGEPLVLSQNILRFDSDLSADEERRRIVVKGQRTAPSSFGRAAIVPPVLPLSDATAPEDGGITVRAYGDATTATLEAAGAYDYSRRVANGRDVDVEVFGVLQSTGQPWDLGVRHHIEIPPIGVSTVMEAQRISYVIDEDARLRTNISFRPISERMASSATSLLDSPARTGQSGEWVGPVVSDAPVQTPVPARRPDSLLDDLGASAPALTIEAP